MSNFLPGLAESYLKIIVSKFLPIMREIKLLYCRYYYHMGRNKKAVV
ncbi:hypothetical protein BMETH_109_0 [methanotrophic bacterial endosymbiont of Bathymodiolus sp.]|nr:hypothetical protein BMETH_109_0 [methanotrophic bacterial endosymbiont of Bathymodiolus sp.]